MSNGEIITFDAQKNFTYIKPLGGGGTGDTFLFKDETTDMFFAIKKYVPKDKQYIDDNYRRFVDEIKILFSILHPNIVRIFNYYLYPSVKTGYLQMEYIDGATIDNFEPDWFKDWNDVFSETVSAFRYLENKNILHRDIRPANILIDKYGDIKIIDFGFGKQIEPSTNENNSIILNWPATEMPNEVQLNYEYNHKTEIYFLGTLFKHLTQSTMDFRYKHVIDMMVKINPDERYNSFSDVAKDISAGVLSEIDFSDEEKTIYQNFADCLVDHINSYINKYSPVENIQNIKIRLADLIRSSSLESYVQNNNQLIDCFINGDYNYTPRINVDVSLVVSFYGLLTKLSDKKQKILYDNLFNRLANIPVIIDIDDDDLPF
ncbi:MAG: protein kinase family protein [Defluviitaleaceae bacterium]|nr:protein kinase family protein [Defluviitaleaceae bacterium]